MMDELARNGYAGVEVSGRQNSSALEQRHEPLAPDDAAQRAASARLSQLYEEHFDFVWRTVRYLGVPDASIDDAVQDTFLVAHRRLADFEARSSPRTWLFAIAMRVVSDHRRSQRRRGRLHQELGYVVPAAPDTPLDHAHKLQARRIVLAALDTLSEEQRAVFVLAELEQLSAPEIEQALEVNLNTVYSRLRAARRQFEKALSHWPPRAAEARHG